MTAFFADEERLAYAVATADVSAHGTGLRGVLRRHLNEHSSPEPELVLKHPSGLAQGPEQELAVKSCFGPDVSGGVLHSAACGCGHVLKVKFLHADTDVVFAYISGGLMQYVPAYITYPEMQFRDLLL